MVSKILWGGVGDNYLPLSPVPTAIDTDYDSSSLHRNSAGLL